MARLVRALARTYVKSIRIGSQIQPDDGAIYLYAKMWKKNL